MRSGALIAPRGLHVATIDVAGIVCRIGCRSLKPVLWARELHPEFLSTDAPDVDVVIEYDGGYWERGLPWIAPDTVEDRPVLTRDSAGIAVTTAYYRARIAPDARRVDVTMASGFRVGGLMRTLYALLLPSREGLLVSATRVAGPSTSALVLGLPGGERERLAAGDHRSASDGLVAVTAGGGRYTTFATPFSDGAPAADAGGTRLGAIVCVRPGASAVARVLGPAAAVARLSPYLCVVDLDAPSVEHVLDVAADLARAVPVYETSALSSLDPGAYGIDLD